MSKRIYQYPEVTELQEGDVMLIDKEGNETAKSILASKVAPALMSKTITERGVYKASDDGVRGYNEVNVNIPYTDIHVATGAIATFEGEDLPLKSLTASIVPVQAGSGDPSPTNVRPISGWTEEVIGVCGKNMLNPSDNSLIQYNQDGNTRYGVIFSKSGTYNVGASATNNGIVFAKKVTNGVYGESVYISTSSAFYPNNLFTITDNDLLLVYTSAPDKATATSWIENSKTQVELNNQATTYEPYAGTTTTIPFTDGQGQSVEVFGGSVDVVNGGEQPQTLGSVDMGDLNWTYQALSGSRNGFSVSISDLKEATSGSDLLPAISSCYKAVGYNDSWTHGIMSYFYPTGKTIIVINNDYTDATAFKTAMAGQKFVYELATPTTFYTQPTSIKSLDGENIVFASTGDVDVEYQTVWVRPTE